MTVNGSNHAVGTTTSHQLDDILTPLPVLTSICVVCRACMPVAALQHVTTSIDAFLCPPLRERKTLEDAVAADNLHLLRRLLAEVTAAIESVQDKQQRRLQHFFVGLQVTKAAQCAAAQRNPGFRRVLESLRTLDPHAVDADEVVAEAAAVHDLELLEWLRIAYPPLDLDHIDSSAAAARAAGNGDIDVLEWLIANRWSPVSNVPVADAVANRQVSVLHWLENNDTVQVSIDADVVSKAAELGDLEMLAWLLARPRDESFVSAGDGAASGGHVYVLEWLLEHHPRDAQCCQRGYTGAARNGHLDVLHWLYAHNPKRYWEQSAEAAAKAGHLAVVQFLFAHRDAGDSVAGPVHAAAEGGHLEVVKFMFAIDSGQCQWVRLTLSVITKAAGSGNLELIKWLHEERGEIVSTPSVISMAITHGHLRVLEYILQFVTQPVLWTIVTAAECNRMTILQWLHAKISEPNSPLRGTKQGLERWKIKVNGIRSTPIDEAASTGNLEMIQWLDANGYGECSTRAMDRAAEYGHLDIVQWLHKHRTEGYTTTTMDKAAANGHLEVVKWLHEHGSKGYTTDAMNNAAANGHIEVVRWLHKHQSKGCMANAVARWLHRHRSKGCTTEAIDRAVRNGHARVVEFLLQHRSEGCTDAAVRSAIEVRRDIEMIHLLFTYRREMVDVERVRAFADGNASMQRWLRLMTSC